YGSIQFWRMPSPLAPLRRNDLFERPDCNPLRFPSKERASAAMNPTAELTSRIGQDQLPRGLGVRTRTGSHGTIHSRLHFDRAASTTPVAPRSDTALRGISFSRLPSLKSISYMVGAGRVGLSHASHKR